MLHLDLRDCQLKAYRPMLTLEQYLGDIQIEGKHRPTVFFVQ